MARLSWAAEMAPLMAKAAAEMSNRVDLSDDEDAVQECLECSCGFTCGTPTALQKHRNRCNARSLPSSPVHRDEDQPPASLSRSLTTSMADPERRSRLRHAHSTVSSSKTQLRRQGTDGTICCPCGFTCGTPMAWERHQERCQLHQEDLPNQPVEQASPPRRPKAMTWAPDPSDAAVRSRPSAGIKLQGTAERKTLRLLLVRHGESANRTTTNKCPDPGLSEKGHRQAMALGQRLQTEFHKEATSGTLRIICSPMLRCLETIQPALDLLPPLPHGSCVCHGACYEHGCAGLSFSGTPADEIVEKFPQFMARGFTGSQGWDYRGSSDRESSMECASRAERVVELLQQSMEELRQQSAGSSPVLILVGHQTLGDLLLHLLLEGSSKEWQYGSPKYRLKNASISELHVTPCGKVTANEIGSDYHVIR